MPRFHLQSTRHRRGLAGPSRAVFESVVRRRNSVNHPEVPTGRARGGAEPTVRRVVPATGCSSGLLLRPLSRRAVPPPAWTGARSRHACVVDRALQTLPPLPPAGARVPASCVGLRRTSRTPWPSRVAALVPHWRARSGLFRRASFRACPWPRTLAWCVPCKSDGACRYAISTRGSLSSSRSSPAYVRWQT